MDESTLKEESSVTVPHYQRVQHLSVDVWATAPLPTVAMGLSIPAKSATRVALPSSKELKHSATPSVNGSTVAMVE
jgi:hypothetical protein